MELSQAASETDAMMGKHVQVIGQHRYCGYRGIVQYNHEHLNKCDVRLEATGKVVMIGRDFLSGLRLVRFHLYLAIADISPSPVSQSRTLAGIPETISTTAPHPVPSTPLPSLAEMMSNTSPAWDPRSRTPEPASGNEDTGTSLSPGASIKLLPPALAYSLGVKAFLRIGLLQNSCVENQSKYTSRGHS
jgi:hypothetical protein